MIEIWTNPCRLILRNVATHPQATSFPIGGFEGLLWKCALTNPAPDERLFRHMIGRDMPSVEAARLHVFRNRVRSTNAPFVTLRVSFRHGRLSSPFPRNVVDQGP